MPNDSQRSLDSVELRRYVRRPQPVEAVQLTEDADWEAIAKWCGGELVNHEPFPGGDPDTCVELPSLDQGAGWLGDWVVLEDGRFDVITERRFRELYLAEPFDELCRALGAASFMRFAIYTRGSDIHEHAYQQVKTTLLTLLSDPERPRKGARDFAEAHRSASSSETEGEDQ